MDSFMDQAQAIWKALDEMSERDPDGYQKFIQEQLVEGGKIFGGGAAAEGKSKGKGTSMIGTSTKSTSGDRSKAKASIADPDPGVGDGDAGGSSSKVTPTPLVSGSGGSGSSVSNSLTDDSFKMSSMLSSIFSLEPKSDDSDKGDGDGDAKNLKEELFTLKELKLPGHANSNPTENQAKTKNKNHRPLIEEL